MKQHWWKILSLLVLVTVTVFSLTIPLKPGLISVDRTNLYPGENTITVLGYNTHFLDGKSSNKVFLSIDSNLVCASAVVPQKNDYLLTTFSIPNQIPSSSVDLYINNDLDGTTYLPNAFHVKEAHISENNTMSNCQVKVNNNEAKVSGIPFQPRIFETIRNLMFHVPMWFTMFLLMIISVVYSIRFLNTLKIDLDTKATALVNVGLVFAILGLISGAIWARFAWGTWWTTDPQLNGAMVCVLIYIAHGILRSSIDDEEKRARISAVYNIFAFCILVVLLMILPRFTDSLHPGKSGNPAFSQYDLDNTLRMLFYPAVLSWMAIGYWIYTMRYQLETLKEKNQ